MRRLFKKPNWSQATLEARSDFRCGKCDTMKPWQKNWSPVDVGYCAICDDCIEPNQKQRSGRPKKIDSNKRQRVTFSLPPEQVELLKTMENRSKYIESLISNQINKKENYE